jgi:hypothetical protein
MKTVRIAPHSRPQSPRGLTLNVIGGLYNCDRPRDRIGLLALSSDSPVMEKVARL